MIPPHWTEEYINEHMDIFSLKSVIEECDRDIKHLEKFKGLCENRLSELSNLKYKYMLRIFYVNQWESGPYYHPGAYNVVMLKIPVLGNVAGKAHILKSFECSTYEKALEEFNGLRKKYKKFNPIISDELPDNLKHSPGDL